MKGFVYIFLFLMICCTNNSFGSENSQQADMIIKSVNLQQSQISVLPGTANTNIVRVQIITEGNSGALNISAFKLNTGESTLPLNDIENAKIYYTGTNALFSSNTLFGSLNSPSENFTISGNTTLTEGNNYFWITYDVKSTAAPGNKLDVAVTEFTYSSNIYTFQNPNPEGFVPVLFCNSAKSNGVLNPVFDSWTDFTAIQGDGAYWILNAVSGVKYSFKTCNQTTDTYIRIYDKTGNVIAENDGYGTYCNSEQASLDWVCNSSDIYYVLLTAFPCDILPADVVFSFSKKQLNAMTFVSDNTIQNTSIISALTNQQIIKLEINTSGQLSPLALTSLSFNTAGTTDAAKILKAKVYYTGNTDAFSTSVKFGTDFASPSGTFTVSGNQLLKEGKNFFWLVYDLNATVVQNENIDAECTSFILNSQNYNTTTPSPAGQRTVNYKSVNSVTVLQPNQNGVDKWETNIDILLLDIFVAEGLGTLPLNSVSVTSKNTTDAAIKTDGVKLFRTSNNTFNTNNPIGTAGSFASGSVLFNNINYNLQGGHNYFWVSYDLSANATPGNILDAKINTNAININGLFYPVTDADPSGERIINNAYSGTYPYAESFENGFGIWQPNAGQQINWSEITGATPNPNAGPNAAYDGQKYLYTPFTAKSQTSVLSGIFNFTNITAPTLSFYYHIPPENAGNLTVTLNDGTNTYTLLNIYAQSVNANNPEWMKAVIDISPMTGKNYVKIIFTGFSNDFTVSDFAIDKIEITEGTILEYVNTYVFQTDFSGIQPGTINNQIMGIRVETKGIQNVLPITAFTFSTAGSSTLNNITNAKIYSTGTTNLFNTNYLFGELNAQPTTNFTINGNQNLHSGNNYFWLVYDISSQAKQFDSTDAVLQKVNVNNTDFLLNGTNPDGNRHIDKYCESKAINITDSRIDKISLGYIENITTANCADYSYFPNKIIRLKRGQNYTLSAILGTCGKNILKGGKVYIDWNMDYIFDESTELIAVFDLTLNTKDYSKTFTVPANNTKALTKMRIVCMETNDLSQIKSCGNYSFGETEDYILSIQDNEAPKIIKSLADVSYNERFGTNKINFANVFKDFNDDPVTYTIQNTNNQVVTATISGNEIIITEKGIGNSTITITASDGILTTDEEFVVTVVDVNDPVTVPNPITDFIIDEGFVTKTIALGSVFADPDNTPLTYTVTSTNNSVALPSIQTTNLLITEKGAGTATIIVTASDGANSADNTFNIKINGAPKVINPVSTLNLNEHFNTHQTDISLVFSDPNNDAITVTAESLNTNIFTVNYSNGIITITEKSLGTGTIRLKANDGRLETVFDFTVNVVNVNDAPIVANPVTDLTLNEHFATKTIDLSNTFTDPDNDALTITAVSQNTGVVTCSLTGKTLTITEKGLGSSVITLTSNDGSLAATSSFTVTVVNVNDAPVVANTISNVLEFEHFTTKTIDLTNTFTDPDNDPLTITAVSQNTGIVTCSLTGKTLTITEKGIGSSVITLTASDGALTNTTSFTVTVTNVNDAPVLANPVTDLNLNEHFATKTIDLTNTFTDPDNNPLTITAVSQNTGIVTCNVTGKTLTITEKGLGSSVITLTGSDGALTATNSFTVTVVNVNDAPVVANAISDLSLNEHFATKTIDLSNTFTDPDNDVLSITVVSQNTGVATCSITGKTLTITEKGLGSSVITLTANDGTLTNTTSFNVTVTNVNDAPVISNPVTDLTLNEHFATKTIDLTNTFTDPDNDALTITAVSQNTGVVNCNVTGKTLTITEKGLGTTTIALSASDGNLGANTFFTIKVLNVNDAPVVTNPVTDIVLNEHFATKTIDLTNTFTDPDGDILAYSVTSANTNVITCSISGKNLLITEKGLGTATVTVTATDGMLTVNMPFSVTIQNINDAPVVANPVSDLLLNEHFTTKTIDLTNTFTDPDNDALTITAVSENTAVVSSDINGKILTVTEKGLGSSVITLTGSDGALTATTSFKITVQNTNDAPVVVNNLPDLILNEYFNTKTIDLSGVFADPDNDYLTFTVVSDNTNAVTGTIQDKILTIKERGIGKSVITITASDGFLTANAMFNVSVVNVNDVPLDINLSKNTIDENLPAGTEIGFFTTIDPDVNETFTYSLVPFNTDLLDNASFNIDGNILKSAQIFDYEVKKEYTINVKTTDAGGASITKKITITVNDLIETNVENTNRTEIKIYPNPGNGIFTVLLNKSYKNINIAITNKAGLKIFYKDFIFINDKIDIDITNHPDGIYFLTITGENINITTKILKIENKK